MRLAPAVCVVAVVCLSLVSHVAAHAKLNMPLAWNPSPSKTAPCGGGAAYPSIPVQTSDSTYPSYDLKTGQAWQFQWQLVAGDGSGPVMVGVDSTYGTNFQGIGTASVVSGPDTQIDVLGTYTLSITIPSGLVCTGGIQGNLCSMQFKNQNGWYACATVTTDLSVANNNSISSVQATCVQPGAQRMFFCTNTAGNFGLNAARFGIWVVNTPALQTATGFTDQDSIANATFWQNMRSALVFSTAKNPDGSFNQNCFQAYHRYLCGQMFPACTGTQNSGLEACKSACYSAIDACGLNPSHQNLFDCATNGNYPKGVSTAFDSVAQCAPCVGDCALTTVAAASHSTLSLVSLLACAAFAVVFNL